MPESSELDELPAASPLRYLRASTVDLAKRLDPLIAFLEDEKGYAELRIEVRRGEAVQLDVLRRFKLNEPF